MEEAFYMALGKVMVLNKNLTIQEDRKPAHEHYSNAGHTKNKLFVISFFSSHLVQDLMSKHLEHLKAKIRYTEIFWPQLGKTCFILCTVAGAVAVMYQTKWFMLWIASPAQLEPNTAGMQRCHHCCICPHCTRHCASFFHRKTNNWTEISYIKPLRLIFLSEASKYKSNQCIKHLIPHTF